MIAFLTVFEDADLDAAVEGAIACKFRSSGQTCVCANRSVQLIECITAHTDSTVCRIYVHSSLYDEFASRLAEKVEKFKVGNGFEDGVTHGPLIHSRAVDKTHSHVEDAKKNGAKVLVGGNKATDIGENFYQPTVLTDVESCVIDNEETFGESSSREGPGLS